MTYKLVKVEWNDACAISSWSKVGAPHDPERCTSVGYLVEDGTDHITVACTISGDEYNAAIRLKRSWVESIAEIKEATP